MMVKEKINVKGNDNRGNDQREKSRGREGRRKEVVIGHVGSQGDCRPGHVSKGKPFGERFVIQAKMWPACGCGKKQKEKE